ncbi:gamma-glutamyltranspeptidase [Sodiomyces alkalinus F11]|uniref:Glutathione hydrolase n=1 Tax=Sodiomyces alkalinus (strain CBS 110278 / VKM F-3762 / F11) TaxID=1314773 RepID=A0A3N2QA19_SODAK|nr:gamma-glutamyltranspeptidase [Sodiomyces alkalinus F11]ROT43586.1 gamma-glutamyltranspeptidase [Sodiomyces alkalinus F11]
MGWNHRPSAIQDIDILGGPVRKNGAVVSENIECSRIGRDLMALGGNAIDAIVGTQLCVGVTAMYHSGIGGGGFAVVRDSEGNYEVVDFRESAPAAASEDMFNNNADASISGGLAVGVPGELKGLEYMHKKYGSLPWDRVVMPASHLAKRGITINADMDRYMKAAIESAGRNFLVEDPEWAEEFAPNGTLLGLGDTIYLNRYAATLKTIAIEGADAFYTGSLAASFVRTVQETGGIMTLDDMRSYRVESREPLLTTFRNFTLISAGVPASGAVCLNTLKILEQFDDHAAADTNLTTHRFDEASRFAYGARSLLGDPSFVAGMPAYERRLLSAAEAKAIRARIRDDATLPVEHYDPDRRHGSDLPHPHYYTTPGFGTSHVAAVGAASGLAATLTSTVNLLFGALRIDPRTGVVLNNEMNDFSIPGVRNAFGFEPSPANFIRPRKRPLSSSSPVLVEDAHGTLRMAIGAAGGSRIISATAQVIWRVLEQGWSLPDAMRAPRLHDQLMPNRVMLEYSFDNATAASLHEKGHNITWVPEGLSAVQAIRVLDHGVFEAVGEPRQRHSGGLTR